MVYAHGVGQAVNQFAWERETVAVKTTVLTLIVAILTGHGSNPAVSMVNIPNMNRLPLLSVAGMEHTNFCCWVSSHTRRYIRIFQLGDMDPRPFVALYG